MKEGKLKRSLDVLVPCVYVSMCYPFSTSVVKCFGFYRARNSLLSDSIEHRISVRGAIHKAIEWRGTREAGGCLEREAVCQIR